jgi:accessory gene regulator protein AgrB
LWGIALFSIERKQNGKKKKKIKKKKGIMARQIILAHVLIIIQRELGLCITLSPILNLGSLMPILTYCQVWTQKITKDPFFLLLLLLLLF